MDNINDYIRGYGQWIEQMIAGERTAHFTTFMFNPMGGSVLARQHQMHRALTEIYTKILTRTCRKPRKATLYEMPILIAAMDFPVYKSFKDHLSDISINDGQHMHGMWLMPRVTRLTGDVSGEFLNYGKKYAGPNRPVSRIVSDRVRDHPAYVGDYLLKAVKNRRSDPDGILILPRSPDEL